MKRLPVGTRRLASAAAAGVLALGAAGARAAEPLITSMQPHGAQRGTALKVTLRGHGLADARIETSLPGAVTLLSSASAGGKALAEVENLYLVELAPDAPYGIYLLRAVTREGLSNAQLFRVGPFPEVEEQAPAAPSLQELELPTVVNGRLEGSERDSYRFHAAAGERVVLEVEARRLGSAIDPVLRVLGPDGSRVASNDDAPGLGVDSRLVLEVPSDGEYRVVVHDARFSQQAQNFYRLKAGRYDFAVAPFPLGGRRGERVAVEWVGGSTDPGTSSTVDLSGVESERTLVSVPGAPAALPVPFAVGEHPERLEPEGDGPAMIPPETVMNGRIARPGEVDRYRLDVTPGKSWLLELHAASLGTSRLFGRLSVHDAAGEQLASAGDEEPDPLTTSLALANRVSADPAIHFVVPDGAEEVELRVEDLAGRGGPLFAYRLTARPSPPDFRLDLVTTEVNVPAGGTTLVRVRAERLGYQGAIRLSIPDVPEGLTVRGGSLAAEVVDPDNRLISRRAALSLTAAPDLEPGRLELEVWGEAELPDGTVLRRRARAAGVITEVRPGDGVSRPPFLASEKPFTAPWLGPELPGMITGTPSPRLLTGVPARLRLVKGQAFDLKWNFVTPDATVSNPELVRVYFASDAHELREAPTPEDEYHRAEGAILVRTSDGTPHDSFDVLPAASVEMDGRTVELYGPSITLDVVQGYRIELAPAPYELTAGEPGGLKGRVLRDPAFNQPITLRPDGLPTGLSCTATEVPREQDAFRIPCTLSPAVKPGEYDFALRSTSWLPGERERADYTIDPVSVRIVVVAPAAEQVADHEVDR